jgi:predicted Zn-ribbon and HTH transcriptional regulator
MKCPGQDKRYLTVEMIKCNHCGVEIEFFSDETKNKCPKCKKIVTKAMKQNCLLWCKYAIMCKGETHG